MRKHLKRLIDRLRGTTNGRFRTPTSARGGLEQPLTVATRISALLASHAASKSFWGHPGIHLTNRRLPPVW